MILHQEGENAENFIFIERYLELNRNHFVCGISFMPHLLNIQGDMPINSVEYFVF
jgi:hypothetical protein